MPLPVVQFLDQNGKPMYGAKLCSYASGTTTPLSTYADAFGITPNTNPVILDVYGRATVFQKQVGYKYVLKTGGDGTCSTGQVVWSVDGVWAIFQQVNALNGLTGTLSLLGTANQVIITPGTNSLTFTLPQAIGTSSNVTFGTVTTPQLNISTGGSITSNGVNFIDASRNANANSYSVNGDGIVDNATNATFHALTILGQSSPTLDDSNNGNLHSVSIDGSLLVNNTRDITARNVTLNGTCTGCPAGPVSSQASGGHVLSTIYQNTGTTPKFINVDLNLAASTTVNVLTDSAATPTTVVGGAGTPGTIALLRQTLSFYVLPGNYYQVKSTAGTATINNWEEWQ